MLNRVWRIVLIVIALATVIWSDLLGLSTWWVSIIAVSLLLIDEILYVPHMQTAQARPAKRRKR